RRDRGRRRDGGSVLRHQRHARRAMRLCSAPDPHPAALRRPPSPTSGRRDSPPLPLVGEGWGEGKPFSSLRTYQPMSVRRLAEKQPESFEFTPENKAWAAKEIAKYPPGRQASAVIALLWRAQKQNGYWLSRPAIEKVAEMLAMPKIRVLEIATFYTMFNLEPVGEPDRVTADGLFSWTEVECLGACCNAPMVQINEDYYEDLTPENFNRLLDDLAGGRSIRTGSQIGRVSSEPVGGLTALATLYGVDGRG